jgi:uncharacterized protein (DUF2132 family)
MAEIRIKNPLHGKTLAAMLTELTQTYSWDELAGHVRIKCFSNDPSIKSSLVFLRRTPWARKKVEHLYLDSLAVGRDGRLAKLGVIAPPQKSRKKPRDEEADKEIWPDMEL